ncbi:MAG: chlorite dismutase family protein [Longimicrobiales bacterium]|nr:chlorite dismutase family protein [Longimicrobiales bacterium]
MSSDTPVLSHYSTWRIAPSFHALPEAERCEAARRITTRLGEAGERVEWYLTGGIDAARDLLVWTSVRVENESAPRDFFLELAAAQSAVRDLLTPVSVLWGMTRPSEYSKARSTQEIDPFADERAPYLIAYPFSKTAEWYLFGRETRQGMMNEHIRLGKQYPEIKQLLLYSVGLQDHEFVVVYEAHDLALFSKLVHELRSTEARRHTLLDTPIHTAVHVTPERWEEVVV